MTSAKLGLSNRQKVCRAISPFFVDVLFSVLLVTTLIWIANCKRHYPEQFAWLEQDASWHLGAEHNQIALAIYNKHGFSDPFRIRSGPTSWTPPVLPYLMSGLYWTCGGRQDFVIRCMLLINAFAVLFTSWIVLWHARKLGIVIVGYAVLTNGLVFNFHQLFQSTNDSGLLMILVNLIWLGFVYLKQDRFPFLIAFAWGLFGGFSALSSPVVGFVWATLTSIKLLGRRIDFTTFVVAVIISVLIVTPWMIRNRVLFGVWIPIKSNMQYELWQSQCLDNEGVLDSHTLFDQPFSGYSSQRERYLDLGEIGFVEERGRLALQSIAENSSEYLRRVANRWAVACIYYNTRPTKDFSGLSWPLLWKRIFFPLPLISVLVVLAMRRTPFEVELWAAIAIWGFGLLPYILISYYDRYSTPLIGVKMLIVLFGVHTLIPFRRISVSQIVRA